jgi:hypothetical protein
LSEQPKAEWGDSAARLAAAKNDPRLAAAIQGGCVMADVHLCCSFPDCNCKSLPLAILAGLYTFGIS